MHRSPTITRPETPPDVMTTRGTTTDEVVVLRDDDPRVPHLAAQGWSVVTESFGAALDLGSVDVDLLSAAVAVAAEVGELRELTPEDVPAVLALDVATRDDYPGGPATAHAPLSPATALPGPGRRAFGLVLDDADVAALDGAVLDMSALDLGAVTPDPTALAGSNGLVAMTYVDVAGDRAETSFTVVAPAWRGNGLGTAVKAASLLALLADDVTSFRTGGSAENAAILGANARLGYRVDERWLTYRRD